MAEEVYESDLINMVIGTHMSIAKGIVKTAENVVKMNADTMQIFSRNPRGSNYKDPTVKEAEEFQRIRREAGFGAILAHAPYTMNLASAKPEVYEFACTVIREDVTRMDKLGIENLVFHPGSHTGIGAEAGIQNIIAGLDQAVIGGGEIGMEALLNVMRHPKLKDLPFYLETPLDDAGHKEEIARLRDLA